MGSEQAAAAATGVKEGRIVVNGPLPTDFTKVFQNAVAEATGCDPNKVTVKESHPVAVSFLQLQMSTKGDQTVEVVFDAPAEVVDEVEKQAADGELEPFGREDTAQELTDQSIQESDEMVDQLE